MGESLTLTDDPSIVSEHGSSKGSTLCIESIPTLMVVWRHVPFKYPLYGRVSFNGATSMWRKMDGMTLEKKIVEKQV